jgi:hypothetical protein
MSALQNLSVTLKQRPRSAPKKDIGMQKIKKTSFGQKVSMI